MVLILYIVGCFAAFLVLKKVNKSLKKWNASLNFLAFTLIPFSWVGVIIAFLILKDIQYSE